MRSSHSSRAPSVVAALAVLAVVGCTSGGATGRPRAGGGPGAGTVNPATGPRVPLRDTVAFGPTRPGPGGRAPTPAAVPRTSTTRQPLPGERFLCRDQPWPRGWIATAYVPDGGQCPGSTHGDAAGAVLVRFDALALHARLEVCADQPTPMGWQVVADEPVEAAADRCPGAASGDAPAMKRIRRAW